MLRRSNAVLCLTALAVLVPGCSVNELPMRPSEFTSGVILYEHANYLGQSAYLITDIRDLHQFTGPCEHDDGDGGITRDWDDCVSSVKVAPGWRATLYRGSNFRDDALEIVSDVPNLQLVAGDCDHDGMNDCVSSVRVRQQ